MRPYARFIAERCSRCPTQFGGGRCTFRYGNGTPFCDGPRFSEDRAFREWLVALEAASPLIGLILYFIAWVLT